MLDVTRYEYVKVVLEAYQDMASALTKADGIDYTAPEEGCRQEH